MMKKRMLGVIAVLLVCIFALSACKKEAGKPVDNAVSEDTTDDSEDTDQTDDAGKYKFGFSVIDMQNPYFITLEEAVQQVVDKEECTMVVKDPSSDADTQAEQIQEMIDEGINAIFLCPVDWEKITPSLQALQEAGVKIINIDSQVKDTDYIDAYVGSNNSEAGKLCGNDLIASGVITECRLRGFSVPDDISVVGFDDLPISSFLEPPLTTVRQERTELGKCGYAALSNLINHVSVSMTLLRPQLITRASTAPCAEREEEAEEE